MLSYYFLNFVYCVFLHKITSSLVPEICDTVSLRCYSLNENFPRTGYSFLMISSKYYQHLCVEKGQDRRLWTKYIHLFPYSWAVVLQSNATSDLILSIITRKYNFTIGSPDSMKYVCIRTCIVNFR